MLLDFFGAYALSFGENILNSSVLYGSSRLIDMISQLKMSEDKGQVAKEYGKKIRCICISIPNISKSI